MKWKRSAAAPAHPGPTCITHVTKIIGMHVERPSRIQCEVCTRLRVPYQTHSSMYTEFQAEQRPCRAYSSMYSG